MIKMIITCPTSYQVAEDEWVKSHVSISCKPETQIKDILQWAADKKLYLGAAIITLIEEK